MLERSKGLPQGTRLRRGIDTEKNSRRPETPTPGLGEDGLPGSRGACREDVSDMETLQENTSKRTAKST